MKLEMEGDDKQLIEIRKILSELNKLSILDMESEAIEELIPSLALPTWKMSSELQKKGDVMNKLAQLSQVEEGVIVKKTAIENINEISETKTLSRLNMQEVKKGINKLFFDFDSTKVNFAYIHAIGNLPDDSFSIIFDQVKKQLPNAKIESSKTKKEVMGKTVIECVLFGSFPED